MHASSTSDFDLLGDSLRAPSPEEAASSLAYWRARLERLPMRRIGARREARAMVVAWEDRLRRAELERHGGGWIGRAAGALAVVRGERPRAIARRTLGALVPRRAVLVLVAAVLVVAVSVGALLGAVVEALF